jgi:hypothetical protein
MGLLASATVPSPGYILTQSSTSINEGDTITFSVQLSNVDAGTLFYWDFGGTAVQDDFSVGSLTGYFYSTGSANADVFLTLTVKKDFNLAAEGTENFYIRLLDSNSVVLKTSQTVYINDTANLASSSGQVEYTTPGTYTFIPGVTTTYSLLAVGGGGGGAGGGDAPGGGGGGGLSYVNGYTLNSGSSYTVFVGAGGSGGYASSTVGTGSPGAGTAGQQSYIVSTSVCRAGYGNPGPASNGSAGGVVSGSVSGGSSRATYAGGNGGVASTVDSTNVWVNDPSTHTGDTVRDSGPGGGAGGYAGAGGTGGATTATSASRGPTLNSGGGAGGWATSDGPASGGGGVGIYGKGADGDPTGDGAWWTLVAYGGGGGSGGGGGERGDGPYGGSGGAYGGGGGGAENTMPGSYWDYGQGGAGGGGACRIIWGSGRAYPSTNTADV